MRFDPIRFLDAAAAIGVLSPEQVREARDHLDDLEAHLVARGVDRGDLERVAAWLDRSELGSTPTVGDADEEDAGDRPAVLDRAGPRYALVQPLARGGMGVVYEATDRALDRVVAVKTLQAGERGPVDRFLREARLTARLEHPNIVPVHDLGFDREAGDRPFLVMKKVKGQTLGQVLRRVRRGEQSGLGGQPGRPEGEAETPATALVRLLSVFCKVCDAVGYAHRQGVLHRDLKPSNIMTGEFGEVLVLDWGIARAIDGPSSRSPGATGGGEAPGTPHYMSPEQARGERDALDERSDVYTLGAILYEILALERSVRADHPAAVLDAVARGRIEPLPERPPSAPWSVPRELAAVVAQAMALRPEDRIGSVGALRADIENFLAGRTLAAARYSPWEIARRWAVRHRTALVGAAATILALVVGGIGIVVADGIARREKDEERRSEAAEAYREGGALWEAADGTPFHPSVQERYFTEHLAALTRMGQGLVQHPDRPPEWSREVLARARELEARAMEVANWPLALFLARSAAIWQVDGTSVGDERVRAVEAARAEAIAADRARLEAMLERLAPGDTRQGMLRDGEVEERAMRLARRTGPAIVPDLIERIAGRRLDGQRLLLAIEILGRKGDLTSRSAGGPNAPELVSSTLADIAAGGREAGRDDEAAAWIRAAVRLESRGRGDVPDLGRHLEALAATHAGSAVVRPEVERARARLDRLDRVGAFSPGDPPAGRGARREWIEEVADQVASGVRSADALAATLADELRPDSPRTAIERAALATLLGLVSSGGRSSIDALLASFEEAWRRSRERGRPASVRIDLEEEAIAAALALGRVNASSFWNRLDRTRHEAGSGSAYWNATEVCQALLALDLPDPRTAFEHRMRGHARYHQGDLAGAIEDLSRAISIEPGSALAHVQRGSARHALGDLAGAEADYDRAIALDPAEPSAYGNRADVRRRRGDLEGAIDDCSRAIELGPDDAENYVHRGAILCDDLRDYAGAILDFTRALDLDPERSAAHLNRGVARRALGDRAGAVDDYSRAIALDPTSARAYLFRGNARADGGDPAGAIEDYGRAIEIDPVSGQAYNARAIARDRSGDLAGALEDFAHATRLDPAHWQAHANRALALVRVGEREAAALSFEAAIRHCPPRMRAELEARRREALGDE